MPYIFHSDSYIQFTKKDSSSQLLVILNLFQDLLITDSETSSEWHGVIENTAII